MSVQQGAVVTRDRAAFSGVSNPDTASSAWAGVAGWASIVIAIAGLLWSLLTPLAYCRYGCPTGALFKLLRFTGDGDRFGARDWLAALCVAFVLLLAPG